MSVEEKDKVSEKISGKKWPACLGSQTFIDRIKETYGAEKINRDVPSSRELLPDKHRILEVVCKSYDIAASDILKMRRGKMNEARNVAIYLTRRLRAHAKITSHFGIPDSGHLWPIFIHEILERASYSCGFAQSDRPNLTQIRAPILRTYFCVNP